MCEHIFLLPDLCCWQTIPWPLSYSITTIYLLIVLKRAAKYIDTTVVATYTPTHHKIETNEGSAKGDCNYMHLPWLRFVRPTYLYIEIFVWHQMLKKQFIFPWHFAPAPTHSNTSCPRGWEGGALARGTAQSTAHTHIHHHRAYDIGRPHSECLKSVKHRNERECGLVPRTTTAHSHALVWGLGGLDIHHRTINEVILKSGRKLSLAIFFRQDN